MNRKNFLVNFSIGLVTALLPTRKLLARSPNPVVGGGCDGCDLIYEGMPPKINNTTHLPGWNAGGRKMIVEGTVYHKDRRTIATNVVVYIYHTDSKGHYSLSPRQTMGKRHGHLRGWVKTSCDGKYRFYTTMPAAYPQRDNPAHIHPVIKEPGINEYYIDEYVFDNDPLLTPALKSKMENRGGSGIIKLTKNRDGVLVCRRDIILGLNIPNYV